MTQAKFNTVQVPAHIAELGFSIKLPTDFNAVPLPPDEPNFTEPDTFFPLYVAMPSYAAVVFTAGAPPLRNYRVEGEVLQQAFLVKDVGDKTWAIVARITADDDNMVRAMNVAEVILTNLSRGK